MTAFILFLCGCIVVAFGLYAITRRMVLYRTLNTRRRWAKHDTMDRGRRRSGYVYAFSDRPRWSWLPSGTIKIGLATDPKSRLASHRTAAPYDLRVWWVVRVPDMKAAEHALHERYITNRVRDNGEWFSMSPGVLFDTLLIRWTMGGKY